MSIVDVENCKEHKVDHNISDLVPLECHDKSLLGPRMINDHFIVSRGERREESHIHPDFWFYKIYTAHDPIFGHKQCINDSSFINDDRVFQTSASFISEYLE